MDQTYYFFHKESTGSTRYFGLSLYENENDFYSLCTYERRTTYRSLSPTGNQLLGTGVIWFTKYVHNLRIHEYILTRWIHNPMTASSECRYSFVSFLSMWHGIWYHHFAIWAFIHHRSKYAIMFGSKLLLFYLRKSVIKTQKTTSMFCSNSQHLFFIKLWQLKRKMTH